MEPITQIAQKILEHYFIFWLSVVVLATLITKPTSPLWLIEAKTIFLLLMIATMHYGYFFFYPPQNTYPAFDGPYDFYHYAGEGIAYLWIFALLNIPVGLSEFLRRIYYKQWHRNFRKNFQYGYISTVSMYAALVIASVFVLLIAIGNTLGFLSSN